MNCFNKGMAILAAIMLASSCSTQKSDTEVSSAKVGLQMYSVRSLMNDYETTGKTAILDSIASFGYDFVEAYGYGDSLFHQKSSSQFRSDINAAGLDMYSSHFSIMLTDEELASGNFSASLAQWDKAIDAHKAAGIKYLLMAWLQNPPKTIADWQTYCRYFNAVGQKCKDAGLEFGYHNHWFEFEDVEGHLPYDILLEGTDPSLVTFEADTYWMAAREQDPVEWFKRYPGRFKLIHIKDKSHLGSSDMVDYKAILASTSLAGTEHVIIEVEWYGDEAVLTAVRKSIEYFRTL